MSTKLNTRVAVSPAQLSLSNCDSARATVTSCLAGFGPANVISGRASFLNEIDAVTVPAPVPPGSYATEGALVGSNNDMMQDQRIGSAP